MAFGLRARFLLLSCVALWALSAGSRFLRFPAGLIPFGSLAYALPVEVPHDGIHVLQHLEAMEPQKCEAEIQSGSKKLLLEEAPLDISLPEEAASKSFLQAPSKERAKRKAERHRRAFACAAGCSSREPQLEKALAPWADWKQNSSGLEMIDALEGFCQSDRESKDPFIMAVLWQNDVYLKSCQTPDLKQAGLYLIGPEDLSLVLIFLFGAQRIGRLPSGPTAFGMYLSDYTSLVDKHLVGPGLPMFAYLGRDTSWLIPWPSSFSVLSTQDVENWQAQKDSNGKKVQKAWDDRESKAYWIGTITGPWEFTLDDGLLAVPRMKLLKMAKEHPQQFHVEWSGTAGYGISWVHDDTNVSGFLAPRSRSIHELTGIPKSEWKEVDEWQNFKYYVNIDGVVLGGRLTKLLSLGGVVLQHQAGYSEHIDALMKPYEHYVPIEYDLSDLVSKIQWLQQNDAEAKRIAKNARALALQRMRFEDHLCYVWRALEALGAKTASAPVTDVEVKKRLEQWTRASVHAGGMRGTMEAFWGEKLEKIHTGNREMTPNGIALLQWAWNRMEGIYEKVQSYS